MKPLVTARGVPILERGNGRILVVGGETDDGATEQEGADEKKPILVTYFPGVHAAQKKVDKKRGREAKCPKDDALRQEKTILQRRKILAYAKNGK
jgi:hypothetical protein